METLAGRLALVTGASRGIGAAVARALHARGARLLLVARGQRALEQQAAALGARAFPCDVSLPADVERLAALVAEDGVPLHAVVHAAGAFELAPITETSVESFDRACAVNLRAAFLLMRAFVPGMRERGHGHMVSIGSIAGRQAFPANGAYSASKFGLRGLHAVLAAELRGTGVNSTLIEPAATDTPLWDAVDTAAHPGLPARSAMLRPEAVADAVLFALTQAPQSAVQNIILERN